MQEGMWRVRGQVGGPLTHRATSTTDHALCAASHPAPLQVEVGSGTFRCVVVCSLAFDACPAHSATTAAMLRPTHR